MAVASAPLGGSLLGKVASVLTSRSRSTGKPSKAAPFLAKIREHVTTFAAAAAFDLSAFQVNVPHLGSAPGWAAVCVSLLVLDFAVRG